MPTTVEPDELKALIKDALVEIIREQPALLRDALEDFALSRAIEEGQSSGTASRDDVFAALEGGV